jgi:hypothetical protein
MIIPLKRKKKMAEGMAQMVECLRRKPEALNSNLSSAKKKKKKKKKKRSGAWWYTPIIPAFRRLRQEDHEFESSQHYIIRHCLK